MGTPGSSSVPRESGSLKAEVQLRVTPLEMKFCDAMVGKVYRLPITVHNLGRWNKKIRFMEPTKKQFKLMLTNLDKELASGLKTTAMVEYHPDKDEDTFDQLLILVGTKTIVVPLMGLIPSCEMEIESVVDFGTLVSNSKVYSEVIRISNLGTVPGMFKVEYQGQLPIHIFPNYGVVKPESFIIVKVDFCADKSRLVNEVAKVRLQGRPEMYLNIKAHVVDQIIELLNTSDERKLECIHFGSVFFETSKIEHAFLYNNSPQPINWVAVMLNDCVGEELGTNIRQTTDFALNNLTYLNKIKTIDITTVFSCVPNEGILLPYQKIVITFCFSPKLIVESKMNVDPSHRQDYAVFLRFETVRSRDGFSQDDISETVKSDQFQKVELALTGSGHPVLLHLNPGTIFKFSPCFMGEHSDVVCTIHNQSEFLPVTYSFPKTAHFKIEPNRGKINEGCIQTVTFSFIPHQVGAFKVKQALELIGPVADKNLQSTSMKPFYHITLNFKSLCKPFTKKVVMKANPGISPLVSNPTGQFVAKDLTKYKDFAPVAKLQSSRTHLHDYQSKNESMKGALMAFPNERAASVRPGERYEVFRTIFTKVPRYTYIDPDFEYTELEKIEKRVHQDYYSNYIKFLRQNRLQKEAARKCAHSNNAIDIAMLPASGLKSPILSQEEIKEECSSTECPITTNRLICTRELASKERVSLDRKDLKGLKSKPATPQEKHDCNIVLTPKQIHQVIIGPSILNFGNICVKSTNTHSLHIINMLPMHIWIQLNIDFEELQNTKIFSYVIPPTCSTHIPITLETSNTGKFWRSFSYTINNIPAGHILVTAQALPVKLELSSDEIELRPRGFLLKTCFWGTVRLYNHQNKSAQFGWQPVNSLKGIAFSIRPAKGIVEAYSSLECEITWHPGFTSPERGKFILHVIDGNILTLQCIANVGKTTVTFLEPRILFNNSPQGLTTWKKAILHNVGQNHAFFKVCDQSLLSTINITPSQGIIPFGGITVLHISCKPSVAEKFDTKAKVAIRCANIIDLRIGGFGEMADIEIEPTVFHFNGTFVGTTHIIPFVIKNKGAIRATVDFDLKDFPEFSINFKDKSGHYTNADASHINFLELEKHSLLECGIVFAPKEVRAFEFNIQIHINSFRSSELYTEYLSLNKPLMPKTVPLIQPCYVQATVLKEPLKLSKTKFVFNVPLCDMEHKNKVTKTEDLIIQNISAQDIQWIFDLGNTGTLFRTGIFKFSTLTGNLGPYEMCTVSISFCPRKPIKYTVDVPVFLRNYPVCFRMLCLIGEIKSPKILFDPPFIFFTPVPLNITTAMNVKILPQNYFRNSTVNFQIPTAKLLNEDEEIQPLSVNFLKDQIIIGSKSGNNNELTFHLSFKSSKPVSFFNNLYFSDDSNNWFSLPVTATAENCILTIYPYLATYFDKQNIILKDDANGSSMKTRGSFLLPNLASTALTPASVKMAPTGTKLYHAQFKRENLFVGMEELPKHLNVDGSRKPNKANDGSLENEEKTEHFFSPKEGSMEHNFYLKVVNAAQTWFSLFGWPEGPHLLSIPETIRRDVQKIQFYSASSPKKFSRQNDFSKYNKTIYDVLLHLSGILPPGISSSQSLPVDDTERVIQLHFQYSSLLDFLNTQGGCISHIMPEFLLEPHDYKKWLEISSSTNIATVNSYTPKEKCPFIIDMNKFEDWSKRAWTDIFLQIYKVLILSRVAPQLSSAVPPINVQNNEKISPCFASSNIYSDSERILLSWLNTNYENTRQKIWGNCQNGAIPSERWIVNFDKDLLDGLVLATQLAAYCPFLIESHFVNMYTQPKLPEQYLHNCLIIINSFYELGLDMGIQAVDICEPNPILMLMLCVYMYEKLPAFLPKKVVPFYCTLYDSVQRQILLKNPSLKNILYHATIVGRDAADFSLVQKGNVITVPPQNEIIITVKFTSRFLHPAEASLLLISKPKRRVQGITVTFALKGEVLNIKAIEIFKCETPCYQWKQVTVSLKNPFPTGGKFNVILVESTTFIHLPSQVTGRKQHLHDDNDASSSACDASQGCHHIRNSITTSIKASFIREFFCSVHAVFLKGNESASLEIYYLPFGVHTRYCAIILSNQEVGELIYILQGNGLVPLPSSFLSTEPSSPIDFNSSLEEEHNKDHPILYLKCKLCQTLEVSLKLPLTNEAKEKALAFAAQREMSTIEYERRLITGTLESSSIRVAVALLGLTKIEALMLFHMSKLKKPKFILFRTELSLPEHFVIPPKIYLPQIPETHPKLTTSEGIKSSHTTDAGFISIPLKFCPLGPGHYPCKILLTSNYDVRVYYIEGVVNEDQPEATFEFETPALEPLTQNIPLTNETKKEWKCQVKIEGKWFSGPSIFHVRPNETVQYPLTFKPISECEIMVSSDLPIIAGNLQITIEPNNSGSYVINACPLKRGILKGTISFSIKNKNDDVSQEEIYQDQELFHNPLVVSETSPIFKEVPDEELRNLRIWYYLEIHTSPGPPQNIIEVECISLETNCIEVPISNPKDEIIHIDVIFTNPALSGFQELTLNPLESVNYIAWYSPATTGYKEESIIFQPEMSEEFWCLLKITTKSPKTKEIPEIHCDLGKYAIQTIPLHNPTNETLELQVRNNNPGNFVVEMNESSSLVVLPHCTKEISVCFYPSGLGRTGHETCINFYCTQFEEWKFYLRGVGLFPHPIDLEEMTTCLDLEASITIPFKNPTKEDVSVNIILTNETKPTHLFIDQCWDSFMNENSAFRLVSPWHTQGIVLSPEGKIDIQVLFKPQCMTLCKTMVIVQIMRKNGKNWPIDNFKELDTEFKRIMGIDKDEIQGIHWMYPIVGLPQAPLPKNAPPVIKCKSSKSVEMTMEITLIGDFFRNNPTQETTDFLVVPKGSSCHNVYEDYIVVPKTRVLTYEIEYESEVMKSKLESIVDLQLSTQSYDIQSETISLVFKIVFTPKKPFRSDILLKIESVKDGIWRFPLILIATAPEVEKTINIKAVGLQKESTMDFRLTSQTRYTERFTAYFLPGSDPEFFVKPETGELPPFFSEGILISVGFKPQMYSKKHKATLVIQTEDTCCLYEINGLPPEPTPLMNVKPKINTSNKMYDSMPIRHRNFIRENAELIRTGVSSTIKGAPLVMKRK
ncbi:cilia- and flagella-associated protein 47 isoform X3 [Cavia porcellus]|uniref:cilia- and flagella-associated protein 47 isoform X3 n=1 Tax=Cavia porcellus TaxID=10141 RepID=UPI002FDFB0F5